MDLALEAIRIKHILSLFPQSKQCVVLFAVLLFVEETGYKCGGLSLGEQQSTLRESESEGALGGHRVSVFFAHVCETCNEETRCAGARVRLVELCFCQRVLEDKEAESIFSRSRGRSRCCVGCGIRDVPRIHVRVARAFNKACHRSCRGSAVLHVTEPTP